MTYGVYEYGVEDYGSTPTWGAFDTPWVFIEVALTTDPGATPAWVDISTDRFVRFTVNRGRQRELDRFMAGRVTIVLTNEDRAFDPTYTSSPFYPNILPMRRIRIRAIWNGVVYVIFSGYVDSWEQQYMPPQGAVCVVSATDAFKVLGNAELLSSVYAVEVDADNPALWWRLGDPSGSAAATEAVTGNYPLKTIGDPSFGTAALNAFDGEGAVQFESIDGVQGVFPEGTFPFSTAGTVEMLFRSDDTISPNGPQFVVASLGTTNTGIQSAHAGALIQVFLVNSAGTIFEARSDGAFPANDNNVHHIAVTWEVGSTIRVYVDGVDRTTLTAVFTGTMAAPTDKWIAAFNSIDYPPFIVSGDPTTFDEVALWTSALPASRIAVHAATLTAPWADELTGARVGRILDSVPWSADDRNIDIGVSRLPPATVSGSALSNLQKVEEAEQGALFAAADGRVRFLGRGQLISGSSIDTFGDSGSELEYGDLSYVYDDQTIVNDVQVSREGGTVQVVGDPTSQARFLRRTKTFDGVLLRSDTDARALAGWWVTHYKDPILRATGMRLEPSAGNQTTHFPHVLGRDLMDRVTVRRRPQNLAPAIDQETLIEGITHDVTAVEWRTSWNLSPAEIQVYWLAGVVGRGEAGVNTRAAF